jgi:putative membrane protein
MRWMLLPATMLVVLAGCSPRNDRTDTAGAPGETGMASTDTSMAGTGSTGSATGSAGATTPTADVSGVLSQLAAANKAEIQQAQAAAKKASASTVKQYANQLVKDHKANSEKLKQVAKQAGVTLADSGAEATSETQSATIGELEGKSGKEFDRAFIAAQIDAHQRNIDKIRNQLLPSTDQPAVRDYLQQTASAMEGHLASAKQLQQDLGGAS